MEIEEEKLEALLKRQAEMVSEQAQQQSEKYLGALKQDFDRKLDAVLEALQPMAAMQEKITNVEETVNEMAPILDATFEKVGELAIEMETIKENLRDHEQRLQKVEAG